MNTTSGFTLKNGRKKVNLKLIPASMKLNTTDRTLSKYERDEIKIKDPYIFLSGMEVYNDVNIGLAYLNEDPVFAKLFGEIRLTDVLRATTAYVADNQILQPLLRWGLNDGNEPLLEKTVRRLKGFMDSMINLYFNITQKQGFAY